MPVPPCRSRRLKPLTDPADPLFQHAPVERASEIDRVRAAVNFQYPVTIAVVGVGCASGVDEPVLVVILKGLTAHRAGRHVTGGIVVEAGIANLVVGVKKYLQHGRVHRRNVVEIPPDVVAEVLRPG